MADSGERNMLFDIRGRRKRVIQVVYALLALLMAASLFVAVGPFSITDAFNTGGGGGDAGDLYDEQIERLERKLRRNPEDEAALVQLTQARYQAGNAQLERDPTTGQVTGIPEEAVTDFNEAGEAWERYLKTNPQKPNANAAQLAAQALLQTSTLADLDTKVKQAAEAQAIFAEAQPSTNAYLTLAQLSYFSGDVAAGDEAGRKAVAEAPESQRDAVEQTLAQMKKAGKQVQAQAKKSTQFQPGAGGGEALQNPLGGLSGGGSGTAAP